MDAILDFMKFQQNLNLPQNQGSNLPNHTELWLGTMYSLIISMLALVSTPNFVLLKAYDTKTKLILC